MKWQDQPFQGGAVLLPLLSVLAKGPDAAADASALVLRGRSSRIWETATRSAPAHAIELTLQNTRLPDENDAAASVVWCPAAHLAAAPRPWVRLLGLTARAWPRRMTEDPILPQYIASPSAFDADPIPEIDRREPAGQSRWTEPSTVAGIERTGSGTRAYSGTRLQRS